MIMKPLFVEIPGMLYDSSNPPVNSVLRHTMTLAGQLYGVNSISSTRVVRAGSDLVELTVEEQCDNLVANIEDAEEGSLFLVSHSSGAIVMSRLFAELSSKKDLDISGKLLIAPPPPVGDLGALQREKTNSLLERTPESDCELGQAFLSREGHTFFIDEVIWRSLGRAAMYYNRHNSAFWHDTDVVVAKRDRVYPDLKDEISGIPGVTIHEVDDSHSIKNDLSIQAVLAIMASGDYIEHI